MDATLPFYVVTLSFARWEDALACARHLPAEALPELRLDFFPDEDPARLVQDLRRRCLVGCRRVCDGGGFAGPEAERLDRLGRAAAERPAWLDLEWELPMTAAIQEHSTHVRLLRSAHVPAGTFDLGDRLDHLPPGDAYAWTGHASRLADNARLRAPLAWARDHGVRLSAALAGPRGIPGRCLQAAWGGAFTHVAADPPPAPEPGGILEPGPEAPRSTLDEAPGLPRFSLLQEWRGRKLSLGTGLCAELGPEPVSTAVSSALNAHFRRSFKDLLCLPMPCADADEALEAMEALDLLGVVLDAGLAASVAERLGLPGPADTLWRRTAADPWTGGPLDLLARGQRFAEGCGG